jgi:hypothetical protein
VLAAFDIGEELGQGGMEVAVSGPAPEAGRVLTRDRQVLISS